MKKARDDQQMKQLSNALSLLVDCQEEEYRSLALDIHDAVGQSLSSVLLRIKILQAQTDSGYTAESLRELEGIVNDSLSEIRRIARVLRPMVLETRGLIPALECLCESVQEHTGIRCRFLCSVEQTNFTRQEELLIYRIMQEALTNAFLHGKAQNAHIAVSVSGSCFVLSIRDDGCGFDTRKADQGIGLHGMMERARMLGGKLIIRSKPGKGTHILMRCAMRRQTMEE